MTGPYRLDRSVIQVSGPDLDSFLQKLLTQNAVLETGQARYGALLTPQGKVVADMILWGVGHAVLIDIDPARADALKRLLSLYKLRSQVALVDLSADMTVIAGLEPFDGATADPRLPALGWRKIVSREIASSFRDGAAIYEAHRLALGVPELARDAAPEEVFALEALLEEMHGVDFQKGCFIGQENVSRMKRRATTRRKFCPITFTGEPPAHGTPVCAGEVELGTVRTGGRGRALALLRLDRTLAVLAAGRSLSAAGHEVHVDPPAWLLMPTRDARAG